MACRATQRIRALSLALECALLGARVRTIHELTGVRQTELLQLLFNDERQPPRGRAPDAREWLPTASLVERVEASVLAANFERLRNNGFCIAESLLSAYRLYRALYGEAAHLGFDRAFDLVAHVSGLWRSAGTSIAMAVCTRCGCEFVDVPLGRQHQHDACPFCKLLVRYHLDPRITAFLQGRPRRPQPRHDTACLREPRSSPPNALHLAWTSQGSFNEAGSSTSPLHSATSLQTTDHCTPGKPAAQPASAHEETNSSGAYNCQDAITPRHPAAATVFRPS
jgi:hypothetical protein